MAKKSTASKDTGTIKQGSIAEFMRKRTQLVGFDFGLNKHTQYAIEFMDNALDAIESFQWKTLKRDPESAFRLKDDMLLENFSYMMGGVMDYDFDAAAIAAREEVDEEIQLLNEVTISNDTNGNGDIDDSIIYNEVDNTPKETPKPQKQAEDDDEEAKALRRLQKKEKELEAEVESIVNGVDALTLPIQGLVDSEPFVIIYLTESEAPTVYADMSQQGKDVFLYEWQIFDNGTGMTPEDLEIFGKYLASSKSQKLKQTRGSQGFGSPSAFSDAQNTTGQPVTVVSKHINHLYGVASEFYTTSKNNKEYVVPPTEVDCPFSHGTYVKLSYLNVRYRKGYIDNYINLTSLTNPHVTIIFIDPTLSETVYPRRVGKFPSQPTYALPHPSSVNIGDFQDYLRSSNNLTVSAFLQDNFVRLSSTLAKTIIKESKSELEDALKFFNLGDDKEFLSWASNPHEPLYFARNEQRVFGRSKKLRDTLVCYSIDDESDKELYWELMKPYNKISRSLAKENKHIWSLQKDLARETVKKQMKAIKSQITVVTKNVKKIASEVAKMKVQINKFSKKFHLTPENEIKTVKITDKIEEAVRELLISKSVPSNLSQKQTEALYKAFKNQKFMSPPTDTAIPIGASIIETTLMKEYKLSLSYRSDLFNDYKNSVDNFSEDDSTRFLPRILSKFNDPVLHSQDFSNKYLYLPPPDQELKVYDEVTLNFDVLHTIEEDFVSGNTRAPTSGKGLAFVVEAAIAISPKIPSVKKAGQVVIRYVNRTPKLRDNSDCAIWKAVQSVKWKNYKLDVFENGIPKGNIRIMINVSGPYVHLMFKSQSKNSLAEDEVLMKEIKFCLETIGRKIRNFQNKKVRRENTRKRSSVIEKFIPLFTKSLFNVATNLDEYKNLKPEMIEIQLRNALFGEVTPSPDIPSVPLVSPLKRRLPSPTPIVKTVSRPSKPEVGIEPETTPDIMTPERTKVTPTPSNLVSQQESVSRVSSSSSSRSQRSLPKKVGTIDDLLKQRSTSIKAAAPQSQARSQVSKTVSRSTSSPISTSTQRSKSTPSKKSASTRQVQKPRPVTPVSSQSPMPKPISRLKKPTSKLVLITNESILKAFSSGEWMSIRDLISKLIITDPKDARFLQLKIKSLARNRQLLVSISQGKRYWKLNIK